MLRRVDRPAAGLRELMRARSLTPPIWHAMWEIFFPKWPVSGGISIGPATRRRDAPPQRPSHTYTAPSPVRGRQNGHTALLPFAFRIAQRGRPPCTTWQGDLLSLEADLVELGSRICQARQTMLHTLVGLPPLYMRGHCQAWMVALLRCARRLTTLGRIDFHTQQNGLLSLAGHPSALGRASFYAVK
jgi:hypothetical protein